MIINKEKLIKKITKHGNILLEKGLFLKGVINLTKDFVSKLPDETQNPSVTFIPFLDSGKIVLSWVPIFEKKRIKTIRISFYENQVKYYFKDNGFLMSGVINTVFGGLYPNDFNLAEKSIEILTSLIKEVITD